jgi:3-deoxy-D-manno-octulosonic-acid transferase
MTTFEGIYTVGLRLVRGISPLLSHGEGKIARGIRGRRGAVERIERWARTRRLAGKPLVWFHAPSVGEGLQARAVMEALREKRPDVQIAYTFFSPSAESFASRLPADVADYLALDLPDEIDRLLDALAPDVIAFSKTEVWPNLTERAGRRAIPLVLLSATLPEKSSRLGGVARRLLSPAHARLIRVAAISKADADRFAELGVGGGQRVVMGDARFDQVWRRALAAPGSEMVKRLSDPTRLTVVAGSTWPADEERLVPAFAQLGAPGHVRLVIAPHEPTPRHITGLEVQLAAHGLSSLRLSQVHTAAADPAVLLIDRVGVLGDLYALADIAYVGGGFGTAGLHSVLEPAAFGAPVLFGPRHFNALEAAALVGVGGAISVYDEAALKSALGAWLRDDELRRAAGSKAREYVEQGLGAAARGADIVIGLLRR